MLINVFGNWLNTDKIYTLEYVAPYVGTDVMGRAHRHPGRTTIFLSENHQRSVYIPEKTCDEVAEEINKQLKERE